MFATLLKAMQILGFAPVFSTKCKLSSIFYFTLLLLHVIVCATYIFFHYTILEHTFTTLTVTSLTINKACQCAYFASSCITAATRRRSWKRLVRALNKNIKTKNNSRNFVIRFFSIVYLLIVIVETPHYMNYIEEFNGYILYNWIYTHIANYASYWIASFILYSGCMISTKYNTLDNYLKGDFAVLLRSEKITPKDVRIHVKFIKKEMGKLEKIVSDFNQIFGHTILLHIINVIPKIICEAGFFFINFKQEPIFMTSYILQQYFNVVSNRKIYDIVQLLRF